MSGSGGFSDSIRVVAWRSEPGVVAHDIATARLAGRGMLRSELSFEGWTVPALFAAAIVMAMDPMGGDAEFVEPENTEDFERGAK